MNKALKIIQACLVILFVLVNVYLMVFNWSVFTVALVVDYGFGTFEAPLVLVMVLIGFITILLLWLISYTKDLQNEVRVMKAKDELLGLKNKEQSSASQLNENHLIDKIDQMQKQIDALEGRKSNESKSIEEQMH